MIEENKQCSRCLITKPLIEFAICNTTPKKIHRKRFCKICYGEMGRERQKIKKLAPQQSLTCDLCKKECKTVMDHDHKTLTFRGWLCNDCNTGLGKFKDNPILLSKAVDYLKSDKYI